MAGRWKTGRRRRKTALILIGLCLAVLGTMVYRYMAFNTWMYSDAKALQPYPVVLIRDSRPVDAGRDPNAAPSGGATTNDTERSIDRALIESNTKERLVVHLSRSDIRFSALGGHAYVKVFLETSLPGEPDRVQRIKFLNVLTRENGDWRVTPEALVQLTLP